MIHTHAVYLNHSRLHTTLTCALSSAPVIVILVLQCSDCGSVLYSFNPITGEAYTAQPKIYKERLDQVMMLHSTLNNYIKPIIMLDTHKQVSPGLPLCISHLCLPNSKYSFISARLT